MYIEVISCDNNKLCIDQSIGIRNYGEWETSTTIISDNDYIDLYKLEGAEAVLHNLNKAEFLRLSDYIEQQKKTAKIYENKGKNVEAKSIISSLSMPISWIYELTDWFVRYNYDIPIYKAHEVPKYKKYNKLFIEFYKDKNANPKEVKSVLNDGSRWSNPSKYLKDSRKELGITVAELKKEPGFGWIDPKGTAKD